MDSRFKQDIQLLDVAIETILEGRKGFLSKKMIMYAYIHEKIEEEDELRLEYDSAVYSYKEKEEDIEVAEGLFLEVVEDVKNTLVNGELGYEINTFGYQMIKYKLDTNRFSREALLSPLTDIKKIRCINTLNGEVIIDYTDYTTKYYKEKNKIMIEEEKSILIDIITKLRNVFL